MMAAAAPQQVPRASGSAAQYIKGPAGGRAGPGMGKSVPAYLLHGGGGADPTYDTLKMKYFKYLRIDAPHPQPDPQPPCGAAVAAPGLMPPPAVGTSPPSPAGFTPPSPPTLPINVPRAPMLFEIDDDDAEKASGGVDVPGARRGGADAGRGDAEGDAASASSGSNSSSSSAESASGLGWHQNIKISNSPDDDSDDEGGFVPPHLLVASSTLPASVPIRRRVYNV
eukprot:TRINITY_DN8146_c0_g1_i1.p1 TRINITY_DN8146_c0_g1~~TRINITY_DN8146_c0_g1_i1.p1  ORF type:complete len:225 (+),score=76.86 TRINITY_DN8146_c0_g1_i1:82-756(+)